MNSIAAALPIISPDDERIVDALVAKSTKTKRTRKTNLAMTNSDESRAARAPRPPHALVFAQPIVLIECPSEPHTRAAGAYSRACYGDCLSRGECPVSAMRVFAAPGVGVPISVAEAASEALIARSDAVALYVDHGLDRRMLDAARVARRVGVPVQLRRLGYVPLGVPSVMDISEMLGLEMVRL